MFLETGVSGTSVSGDQCFWRLVFLVTNVSGN